MSGVIRSKGRPASAASAWSSAANCSPPAPGICRSTIATSKAAPAERSCSSAVSTSKASVTPHCHKPSTFARTSRLVALSSTTRIRRCGRDGRGGVAGAGRSNRAVNQNRDPWPSSLEKPTCPPMSSTRRATIDKPRPVPPYRLVVVVSACEKGRNSRSTLSGGIPIPESATSKRSVAGSPGCANSTAMETSP